MQNPEWRRFFDDHAPRYLGNGFARGTVAEVDFLLELLELPRGARLLDVGCGVGRHSLELARRGYTVTGADLSPGMLAEARRAAAAAGLAVEWVETDASRSLPAGPFAASICLCEGAFCLLSADDDPLGHDRAILGNVRRALAPGGSFVLTALSALRAIRAAGAGFDTLTMTEATEMPLGADGKAGSVKVRERYYTPPELRLVVESSGFEVLGLWGGTAGNFGRRPLELDEYEIMVYARRKE